MVLTDTEYIQAQPIGQFDLLQDVLVALFRADGLARARVGAVVDEGIDAELH